MDLQVSNILSGQYAFHALVVGAVLICAILVYVFGFKSAIEPPFDKLTNPHDERKATGKKRKAKDKKSQSNGHATAVSESKKEVKQVVKKDVEKSPVKEKSKSEKNPGLKENREIKPSPPTPKVELVNKGKGKENVELKQKKKQADEKPKDYDDGEWEQAPSRKDKKNKKPTVDEAPSPKSEKKRESNKKKDEKVEAKVVESQVEIAEPEFEIVEVVDEKPEEVAESKPLISNEVEVEAEASDEPKPRRSRRKKGGNSNSGSESVEETSGKTSESVKPVTVTPKKVKQVEKPKEKEAPVLVPAPAPVPAPVPAPPTVTVEPAEILVTDPNVAFDELGGLEMVYRSGGSEGKPQNVFRNDGSFLEMFKKLQETKGGSGASGTVTAPEEKAIANAEVTSGSATASEWKPTVSKPPPFVGKRRGGRVLPTAMIECDEAAKHCSRVKTVPYIPPHRRGTQPVPQQSPVHQAKLCNDSHLLFQAMEERKQKLPIVLRSKKKNQSRAKCDLSIETNNLISSVRRMHCHDLEASDSDSTRQVSTTEELPKIPSGDICFDLFEKPDENCIIEMFDFPEELRTQDLLTAFSPFVEEGGFKMKWVDDTHAIGIFSNEQSAKKALECRLGEIQTRPICDGILASRCKANVLPPAIRPKTCTASIKRMVSGALGVKPVFTAAQIEEEQQILKEIKEKRSPPKKQSENSQPS